MPEMLSLPRITHVRLWRFSLYPKMSEEPVEFDRPVFCLAGANGLGKSTFLNCIVYALTGVLRKPDGKFKSIEEFIKDNQQFTRDYFDGRLRELDRSISKIQVSFTLGSTRLTVTRDFVNVGKVVDWQGPGMDTPKERDTEGFEKAVAHYAGLNSFHQFAFLVNYVLTFDESRGLIFWNPAVLTSCLRLVIGLDPEKAHHAESLKRQFEKYDSRVRNTQWQITQTSELMDRLERITGGNEAIDEESAKDIWEQQRAASRIVDELQQQADGLRQDQFQVMARIAELTSHQQMAKREYDRAYAQLFQPTRAIHFREHPALKDSLVEHRCALCGATGSGVADHIRTLVEHSHTCPLCSTAFDGANSESEQEHVRLVQGLDADLRTVEADLANQLAKKSRIDVELEQCSARLAQATTALMALETNPVYVRLRSLETRNSDQRQVANTLLQLEAKKAQDLLERNKYKDQMEALTKELASQYRDAEEHFLPLFRDLAEQFMGRPVTIRWRQSNQNVPELRFTLEVDNAGRKSSHQLSESQRFFIDIALRMAFVRYVSRANQGSPGLLLLDTPEGSLDVAYEANAGKMLADFACNGHQLVLTANINSSGLIQTLAEQCRDATMHLHDMLDWVDLTRVQLQHRDKFVRALDNIRSKLAGAEA